MCQATQKFTLKIFFKLGWFTGLVLLLKKQNTLAECTKKLITKCTRKEEQMKINNIASTHQQLFMFMEEHQYLYIMNLKCHQCPCTILFQCRGQCPCITPFQCRGNRCRGCELSWFRLPIINLMFVQSICTLLYNLYRPTVQNKYCDKGIFNTYSIAT